MAQNVSFASYFTIADEYCHHPMNEHLQADFIHFHSKEFIVTLNHFSPHIHVFPSLVVVDYFQQIVTEYWWYFVVVFSFCSWLMSDYVVIRHQKFVFFVLYCYWGDLMSWICTDCWDLNWSWLLVWNFFWRSWFLLIYFSFCLWVLLLKQKSWQEYQDFNWFCLIDWCRLWVWVLMHWLLQ